jgi:glycosyltransferase involved in cell wall biosynthesis
MLTNRKLRVAIDCRISDPQQGVGTAILFLAKALSQSQRSDQEYTFLIREDLVDWLAPYIYGPCRITGLPMTVLPVWKRLLRATPPIRYGWGKLRGRVISVPTSDGYLESQEFNLVHFPTQSAFLTELPSIYQPWDLQHLHYPQFFTSSEILLREKCYRAYCHRAIYVCVQAEWTRQDVIKHYGLPADKVVVVPWGSVFDAYTAPSPEITFATAKKYGLPDRFFFYPAVTWPHKNHEGVLRALQVLKTEHGIAPHVYFTGSSTEYCKVLDKLAQDLGVFEQTHFLGFLTPEELQAIFSLATAMVFASKFEGFGLPILESFHARLPVLSSNATTLPEVAGDAALYFDPDSPSELAALMKAILDTPELRQDLIKKGTLVLSQHSINDTATDFQALYERVAALSLQEHRLSPVSTAI